MGMEKRLRDFLYFLGYFYLQHRKLEKALVLFRALNGLGEGGWRIHMAMAQTMLMMDDAEGALEEARKAHRLCDSRDDEQKTLFLLARAMWALGDEAGSREHLEKFLEMRRHS